MAPLTASESAALQLLEQLEKRAHLIEDVWKPAPFEFVAGEWPIEQGTRLKAIVAGSRALAAIGELDEGLLETYALLLSNAHTLVSLARIGLERVASFEVPTHRNPRIFDAPNVVDFFSRSTRQLAHHDQQT
jgi:hypothetical protein